MNWRNIVMPNCIYIYKGHKFNSELELDDFLLKEGDKIYSKYGDIAFESSEGLNNTLQNIEKINKITSELDDNYKVWKNAHQSYLDGEDTLEFDPPYVGVTSFIRGLTNSDDKLLTPEFREFDYWSRRIASWKNPDKGFNDDEKELFGDNVTITDTISNEELKKFLKDYETKKKKGEAIPEPTNLILKLIVDMKLKWEVLGKTGTAIHEILRICFSPIKEGSNKGKLFIDTVDPEYDKVLFRFLRDSNITDYLSNDRIVETVKYAKLLAVKLRDDKMFGPNCLFFPEFKVSTLLSESLGHKDTTLMGIIDLMVIDSNGDAHIIDYKCTPKVTFNTAKERGFWYLLGIYSRMLQSHDITMNSDTPKIMTAPIIMEKFRKLGDTYVMDKISWNMVNPLTDITDQATLDNKITKNLDEFIPEKKFVAASPKDVVVNVNKFVSAGLQNASTAKSWDNDEEITKFILKKGGILFDETLGKHKWGDFTGDSESEVFEKIKKYLTEEVPKNRRNYVLRIIRALKKGMRDNTTEIDLPKSRVVNRNEGGLEDWFINTLGMYCSQNYELVEKPEYEEFGILCIKHKGSNLLDFILIVSDNIEFEHKFSDDEHGKKSDRRTLLTGAFARDLEILKDSQNLALKAYNGNIHAMEVMAVLNCDPNLNLGGSSIGKIHVINPGLQQGMSASNEELIWNFNWISDKIQKLDASFVNQIDKLKFASKVKLAYNRLKDILYLGNTLAKKFNGQYAVFANGAQSLLTDLDTAIDLKDNPAVDKALKDIKEFLEKADADRKTGQLSILLTNYNENENLMRSLYNRVLLAMAEQLGFKFRLQTKDNDKFLESIAIHKNGVLSLLLDNPGNLNNDTLNLLTTITSQSYQNIREDTGRELGILRPLVDKLKLSKGFSKLKEMTVGNQASLYQNMIDDSYEDDLVYKNPWSPAFSGTKEELEFLKHVILKINLDRYGEHITEIEVSSGDIKYLRIPIVPGDLASQAAQMGSLFKALGKKMGRLNPKIWWEDMQKRISGIFSDYDKKAESELYKMTNMFERNMEDIKLRKQVIAEHGKEYFETNMETLLLKHTFAYSMTKHINLVMPMAKAAMIHLSTLGHLSNKQFENTTNYVKDFLINKIKGETLVDSKYEKAAGVLSQLKLAASLAVLGFSPVQGYLNIQGLWTDLRLIFLHMGQKDTPFTIKHFKFAFKTIYKDLFHLGNKQSVSSLLNEYYGWNDMDTNVLADKLKSDKYGFFNLSSLAYYTASRPDYFNRMLILLTYMNRDGSFEAHSIKDGRLHYDWTKDKRFKAFAENDTSNMEEYEKAKGLYYAMAELLVKERALNPDGTYFRFSKDLTKPTPLPKAYTNLEMESYKSLSDDIYGYYSHEKKSMIHAYTLGALWIQMRTYWSGKKNQYLGAPGITLKGRYEQLVDKDGNKLYWVEEDGILVPTTLEKANGRPVIPMWKWSGDWLEGVIITLAKLYSDARENGWKTTFDDMWDDPLYRANMKLIMYDLTVFFIGGTIIAGLMSDWDDELTKEAKLSGKLDEALIASAAHVAVKTVSNSFLDFNFVESIGAPIINWEPMSFEWFSRRIADLGELATGDKDFKDVLLRMSTFTSLTKTFWDVLLEAEE